MSGAAGCVRDRTGTQKTEMSNLTVPQDLGEITPAWLTAALHGKAASSRAAVTGYSAEPIAEGKGFMNQVVRLRLHYDDDPLDLPRTIIAKLPSAEPGVEDVLQPAGTGPARSQVLSGSGGRRPPANPAQLSRWNRLGNRQYHSAAGGFEQRPPGRQCGWMFPGRGPARHGPIG